MIISELQGGENDPDQLLDQELTATAFHAHPYRHPTIGWLERSADDDARRPLRLLPALLRAEQRDAGHRRRRRHRTMRCGASSSTSAGFRPAHVRRGSARASPSSSGERRVTIAKEGTTAYLKIGVPRARGRRPDFLPDAGARCGADRREGREPVGELPHAAAAAQRAPVSRARRHGAGLVRVRRAAPDRSIRSSTRSRVTATEGVPLEAVEEAALSRSSTRPRATASRRRELQQAKHQLRARLVFENDSVTNIAHQLGYFRDHRELDAVHALAGSAIEAVTLDAGRRGGGRVPACHQPHGRLVRAVPYAATRIADERRSSRAVAPARAGARQRCRRAGTSRPRRTPAVTMHRGGHAREAARSARNGSGWRISSRG